MATDTAAMQTGEGFDEVLARAEATLAGISDPLNTADEDEDGGAPVDAPAADGEGMDVDDPLTPSYGQDAPTADGAELDNAAATFRSATVALWDFPDDAELLGDAPDKALIEKIVSVGGLLEPVTLVNYTDGAVAPEHILSGRRRIKALRAILAGRINEWNDPATRPELERQYAQVPVRVTTTADTDAAPALVLISHSTRRPNAAADLRAIETLLERGLTVPQIAAASAVPTGAIKAVLRLQRLSPALRRALDENRLPTAVAHRIARLNTAEDQAPLERLLADKGKITMTEAIDAVKAHRQAAQGAIPVDAINAMPDVPDTDDDEPQAAPPYAPQEPGAGLNGTDTARLLRELDDARAENRRLMDESNAAVDELEKEVERLRRVAANWKARQQQKRQPYPDAGYDFAAPGATE